jgi:phytoene synthase
MSAYDYCRDKVALPGSSLYYSVLFVTPRLREALTALHAAAEEFREVAEEVSDEGVARAKLAWWAQEMQRAGAGEPRHPITRVLAGPMRDAGVDPARFVAVLNAFVEHQARDRYRTFAELESHCERVADMSGCMAAELCGFESPATLQASRHLGVGLALGELARRPLRAGARRETDLPADLLAELGVVPADVRADAGLEQARRAVARNAHLRLRRALDEMPAADHAAQSSRRALAEMGLAQLRAMDRAGYAALERPVAATPLRKLWIAWKHRQR